MGIIAGSRARQHENAGPPTSGTSGTKVGDAQPGDLLIDTTNGIVFQNEGTVASPYWTPVGYDQAALFGAWDDWRSQVGKPVANTDAETILSSGVRVFGQGIVEVDSGLVIQTPGEGNVVARLTTTNEDVHLAAIGLDAGVYQPDQHSLLVVEAELTHVSDINDVATFIGFLGTAADALDPPVTIATTTATLVQDDLAGLVQDSDADTADRFYGVHNKSNESATQDLSADGDTGTNLAAAGTYQRFRVEIDASGNMVCFIDKTQVYQNDASLDADEECAPVLAIWANTDGIQEADVRRFATWAVRP